MIRLRKSKDGQFYFTIHARNGRKLVTSETYKTKQSAKKTANAVVLAMFRFQYEGKAIIDETLKK